MIKHIVSKLNHLSKYKEEKVTLIIPEHTIV